MTLLLGGTVVLDRWCAYCMFYITDDNCLEGNWVPTTEPTLVTTKMHVISLM